MKKTSLITLTFFIVWVWMGISFTKSMGALRKEEQLLKRNPTGVPPYEERTEKGIIQKQERGDNPLAEIPKEEIPFERKMVRVEQREEHSRSQFFHFEQELPFPYPDSSKLSIYGDESIDSYIRRKAEERGYTLHKEISKENLAWFGEKRIAREVTSPMRALIDAVRKRGGDLRLSSGYRSTQRQREIFRSKLGKVSKEEVLSGKADKRIDVVLSRSSIPGYSKHHTGYAFDFVCGEHGKLTRQFKESPCYHILSEDNFSLPKKYGFLPSYPEGETHQGPDPEPWEFVWVGNLAYR